MKVAVSAMGGGLDTQVAPNFGRCPYFVIVDTDTMGSEALPNMAQGAASGAGIQAAQTVISRGVKTVLTGNVGPNAFQVFSSTGVQIITGVSGTVREAVEKFKRGELRAAPVSQQPLYGVPGSGMGYGRGMGRGVACAGEVWVWVKDDSRDTGTVWGCPSRYLLLFHRLHRPQWPPHSPENRRSRR